LLQEYKTHSQVPQSVRRRPVEAECSKREQRRPEKPGHPRWTVEYGLQSVMKTRRNEVIDEPQCLPHNTVRRRGMTVQTCEDILYTVTRPAHLKAILSGAFSHSRLYCSWWRSGVMWCDGTSMTIRWVRRQCSYIGDPSRLVSRYHSLAVREQGKTPTTGGRILTLTDPYYWHSRRIACMARRHRLRDATPHWDVNDDIATKYNSC